MTRKFMRRTTKVIDGDTIKVNKPVRGSSYIRIAGKNAPEKGETGFQNAKNNLRSRVGGRKVWINPVGKSYGRTVARVRKVRRDKK